MPDADQAEAVKAARAKRRKPPEAPAKSDEARAKLGIINPTSRKWMPTYRAVTSLPGPVKRT